MTLYHYRAKKGPRDIIEGDIEAQSYEEAVAKVEKMGLVPVAVTDKKISPAEPLDTASALPAAVSSEDVDIFTRQLASLVKTHVPLLKSLSLISSQTENKAMQGVVRNLHEQVRDGRMLSEAMAGHKAVFDSIYLAMVRSGERAGVLDETLSRLSRHREKAGDLKRRIRSAMAYPALVMIVGAGTVFAILTFFMPKLTVLFESMGQALPLPTRIVMGISSFMSANWAWLLLAAGLFFAMSGRARPGSKKKFFLDMIRLRLPFVKKMVKDEETARFAATLGLLVKSGLSVHEATGLAAAVVSNDVFRHQLKDAADRIVSDGMSLSESFKRAGQFPAFAVHMIAVGEEGGRLEESLAEIAGIYEKQIDDSIKIMTSLIEPLLILAVGSVVGLIVFAMLLPIFNIGLISR